MRLLALFTFFIVLPLCNAQAGLDLDNQTEIHIEKLDLDHDGRIQREEMAKYLFFYFDRDGNETLTKGEYHKRREITVIPYEGEAVTFIDLDNDAQNDEVVYDTPTFLNTVMIDEYDPDEDGIKALEFMDIYFLRLDSDKSGAIELDEWQKHYKKFAVKKGNSAPKAANNDYYQD